MAVPSKIVTQNNNENTISFIITEYEAPVKCFGVSAEKKVMNREFFSAGMGGKEGKRHKILNLRITDTICVYGEKL